MLAKVDDVHVSLTGKQLTPSHAAKDCGVFLDNTLTFNEHIRYTASSCMARLGQINRVKHCLID